MTDEERKRRDYDRIQQWKKAHPEKCKAYAAKSKAKNRGKIHAAWKVYAANHRHIRKAWEARNKDARKAYNESYREANRERLMQQDRDRYANNKERVSQRGREYRTRLGVVLKERKKRDYQNRRETVKQKSREYRERNRDKVAIHAAEYRARAESKARINAYLKTWRKSNRALINAWVMKRRATRLNATPPWVELDAIAPIYREAERITKETGIQHDVDHIVPLQSQIVCGLHVPWNLQVLEHLTNVSKHNRLLPHIRRPIPAPTPSDAPPLSQHPAI